MCEDIQILCVDDEKNVLRSLQRLFMDEDYEILTASTGEQGLAALEHNPGIQLVISDYRMPGMDGVQFLKQVCQKRPNTIRIVLSGYADTAAVVEAINEGQIYKFIAKPWNDDDLIVTIQKAIEVYFLHQKNEQLNEELLVSNEKLISMNDNLEQLVEEKTSELLFQNRTLQGAQNILNYLPIAVMGMDNNGLIVQSNTMAEELFKNSRPAIINMIAKDVLPSGINQIIVEGYEQGTAQGKVKIENAHYSIRVVKMKENQGQEGIIVICIQEY